MSSDYCLISVVLKIHLKHEESLVNLDLRQMRSYYM